MHCSTVQAELQTCCTCVIELGCVVRAVSGMAGMSPGAWTPPALKAISQADLIEGSLW